VEGRRKTKAAEKLGVGCGGGGGGNRQSKYKLSRRGKKTYKMGVCIGDVGPIRQERKRVDLPETEAGGDLHQGLLLVFFQNKEGFDYGSCRANTNRKTSQNHNQSCYRAGVYVKKGGTKKKPEEKDYQKRDSRGIGKQSARPVCISTKDKKATEKRQKKW